MSEKKKQSGKTAVKSVGKRQPKKKIAGSVKPADAPVSVQQTIAYKNIYPDGICRIDNRHYSKTVQFYDINYQLAQNEDKNAIFESYCDFLNYFDHSISVQFSFINQHTSVEDFQAMIAIPEQEDEFNDIREEYSNMLKNQLTKGNNGLTKTKYVTFTVEAKDLKTAKQRLERVETDVLNNFKTMGVKAEPLNGHDRLRLLFDTMKDDKRDKFNFSWDMLKGSGMSTKDFIAPSSMNFSGVNTFRMGRTYGAVSYLQITAPELTDRML
ncbi:MAG: VirB4-like conjugal transfer ATPase, partial [Candidatus Ornithomonoglobus sp.]